MGFGWLSAILAAGGGCRIHDCPIFVPGFNKACEYGDWPKVVMASDATQLQSTYREIIIWETAIGEIIRLIVDYPPESRTPLGAI